MALKKLSDYINTSPLTLDFPYDSPFVHEYMENMDVIDVRMKTKFGSLPLIYDNISDISAIVRSTLIVNRYKHMGLYKTTILDYNPIWNVEGTETTTTTHGATETSNTYADKITEHETVYANKETTNTQGERTKNEKYSEYPYDTQTKTLKNERDNTENAVIDTVMEKGRTDNANITEKGRTDKTNTTEYIDTTVLDRHGNIGVTSTQNLIGQERTCVNFVFWDIVIADVVKEITIPFYEDISNDFIQSYYKEYH